MNRKALTITLLIITLITLRLLITLKDQTTLLSLDHPIVTTETINNRSSESTTNINQDTASTSTLVADVESNLSTEPTQNNEIRAYSPETDTYYTLDAFNKLDKEALMTFRGVGEVTADAIIKYREENGPFKAFEELMEIKGIGEKKLAKIISENP